MNNEAEPQLGGARWLGRLEQANHLFAFIQPLAEWVNGDWVEVTRSAPNSRHRISVKPGELGANKTPGSVWVFDLESSRGQTEKRVASRPIRAAPIIDVSDLNIDDARRLLTEQGVHLPLHQGRQAFVLFSGARFAEIKFERQGKRWFAKPPDGLVSLCEADQTWRKPTPVDGFLYLPSGELPGRVVQTLDWSSDAEFLSRLVKKYRIAVEAYSRANSSNSDSLVRRIEHALDGLRESDHSSPENVVALADRLREGWPVLSAKLGLVAGIGEFLLASDEGRRALAEAVEQRRKELEADLAVTVRSDLELHFAQRRQELSGLDLETKQALGQLAALKSKVGETATALESSVAHLRRTEDACRAQQAQLHELDERIATRRSDLHDVEERALRAAIDEQSQASKILASKEELSSFLRRLREHIEVAGSEGIPGLVGFAERMEAVLTNSGQPIVALLPSAAPPWWAAGPNEAAEIPIADLGSRLIEEARLHRLEANDLRLIDGLTRAGEPVLLLGECADLACTAYARIVAGGRIRRVMLDPSFIGIDDLWRIAATGRPTAFAAAWHRAIANPDETVLVCLCSLDSAPVHLWLSQLCEVLRAPERPVNLLVVATGSAANSDSDPYVPVSSLVSRFVLLSPRQDASVQMASIALQPPPAATKLRWSEPREGMVPSRDLLQIAGRATSLVPVQRVLRARRRLAETELEGAQQVSLAWLAFLETQNSDSLPAALRLGVKAAESLHFQH